MGFFEAVEQLGSEDALVCVERLLGNAQRHDGPAPLRHQLILCTRSRVAEEDAAAASATGTTAAAVATDTPEKLLFSVASALCV